MTDPNFPQFDAAQPATSVSPPPLAAPKLPSLSQNVRSKTLKRTKGLLIAIGVITAGVNLVAYLNAKHAINEAIRKELDVERANFAAQGMRMVVDDAKLEALRAQALVLTQTVQAGFVILGLVFMMLGVNVQRKPVPITILALILYLGGNAITFYLEPRSIYMGIIVKILIIGMLIGAIRTALAYEQENQHRALAMA